MRPFFSYYGAKYTMASKYGPPNSDTVIEPFAGSACYSTFWNVPRAILSDLSPDVCALWTYLIEASPDDISALPRSFDCFDQVLDLPHGARQLVQFWIAKGRAEPSGSLSPWYFQYRSGTDCRVWGDAVKHRIASQVPKIKNWEIHQCDFRESPSVPGAHWHIDPPYNNSAGRRYPIKFCEYEALAAWAKTRPGTVDVCENSGSAWLPFESIGSVITCRGRRTGAVSDEAAWSKRLPAHPANVEGVG